VDLELIFNCYLSVLICALGVLNVTEVIKQFLLFPTLSHASWFVDERANGRSPQGAECLKTNYRSYLLRVNFVRKYHSPQKLSLHLDILNVPRSFE
jgi:hypothetical protein